MCVGQIGSGSRNHVRVEHDDSIILRNRAYAIGIGNEERAVRPGQPAGAAKDLLVRNGLHGPWGSASKSKRVLAELGPSSLAVDKILSRKANNR